MIFKPVYFVLLKYGITLKAANYLQKKKQKKTKKKRNAPFFMRFAVFSSVGTSGIGNVAIPAAANNAAV